MVPLVFLPWPSCYRNAEEKTLSRRLMRGMERERSLHLVVVTRSQVDHDMLVSVVKAAISHCPPSVDVMYWNVPIEEHDGTRVV